MCYIMTLGFSLLGGKDSFGLAGKILFFVQTRVSVAYLCLTITTYDPTNMRNIYPQASSPEKLSRTVARQRACG